MSKELLEELQDWVWYREAHPDAWQGAEWGEELLRKIAAEVIE